MKKLGGKILGCALLLVLTLCVVPTAFAANSSFTVSGKGNSVTRKITL